MLLGTTMLTPVAAPFQPALAQGAGQAQARGFSIPAQPLSSALSAFITASGWQVGYSSSIASGVTSQGVSGTMTAEQALRTLLSGTGISVRMTGANTATLVQESAGAEGATVDGAIALDTIDVSGGGGASDGFTPDTPYQTAGSSTYISSEKIDRFRGTSVGDMLSGTPGVLNADNRNGAALDVNIRGMQGQNRVPISVDGAVQETTVYRGYSGIAGRSYVDPDFIGSVMVEKGPSSAADGSGVIGGIVRMNTIGVDDILLPGKNSGIRFKGGFNTNSSSVPPLDTTGGLHGAGAYPNASLPTSFGGPDGMDRPSLLEPTGGNGSIAAGFRSEHIDVVAAYAQRKNGNYHAGRKGDVPSPTFFPDCGSVGLTSCGSTQPGWTGVVFEGLNRYRPGEEVLNTSQDNSSMLLKSTVRLPSDQQIDLSYMSYESDYGEIMPSQIMYSEAYGAYQARLHGITMDTYTAKYKWNPADNDLIKFKAGLWMTDAELTTPYAWYGYNDFPELSNFYGSRNKRWGLNIENVSTFDGYWGNISLSYGGSFTRETLEPGEGADVSIGRAGNRREVSLFTASEWKPADWLTLNGALRYTEYKAQDSSQILNPTGEVFAEYKGDGFAPTASATVEPWEGIQFYAKYAEAIRGPSAFEITRGFSTGTAVPGFGNGLLPEHAKTWEFGSNVLRDNLFIEGDKARLKASYFDNNVENYLTRTFMSSLPGQTAIVNIDSAKLRGIELSASYDMGRVFGELSYTHYIHTEFCNKPGQASNPNIGGVQSTDLCFKGGVPNSYVVNQLPPKDMVSLTLGMRAFEDQLTFGGRMTYIGERPTSGIGISGTDAAGGTIANVKWTPYTLLDLFASYKINEQFQLDLTVDNVTDVYYMDTLTLGLMPSPGRTLRTGITARF
ncbi:TonB-dependent receptor [Hyphomicrobium sulfonivorans]|uniref:TonB-dependent receptor n=1 Tax=Hyphomicrobium sulfonivorans TaxID=121290 RepID=UPI0018DC53A2|nr:TonB-dependent receptor [Hyphomicrobium sulfonivorans]